MKRTRDEVSQIVQETISTLKGIPVQDVKDDMVLNDDLGMDSLDLIETVMVLENVLGIMVDEDAGVDNTQTVKEFIESIYEICNES